MWHSTPTGSSSETHLEDPPPHQVYNLKLDRLFIFLLENVLF